MKLIIYKVGKTSKVKENIPVNVSKDEESKTTKTLVSKETKTIEKKTTIQTASGKYVPYWQSVLDKVKQSGKMTIYVNLIGTKGVLVNDLIVGIEFPGKITDFARNLMEEHDNKALLEKIVSMEQGNPMQIRLIDKTSKNVETTKKQGIEGLAEEMDLPFNIIEE